MFHIIATFAAVIALVAFVTNSKNAARATAAVVLAGVAAFFLFVVGIAALDIARQSAVRPQTVIHHGSHI